MDYDQLANIDRKLCFIRHWILVNEASRLALKKKSKITMKIFGKHYKEYKAFCSLHGS